MKPLQIPGSPGPCQELALYSEPSNFLWASIELNKCVRSCRVFVCVPSWHQQWRALESAVTFTIISIGIATKVALAYKIIQHLRGNPVWSINILKRPGIILFYSLRVVKVLGNWWLLYSFNLCMCTMFCSDTVYPQKNYVPVACTSENLGVRIMVF